MRLFDWELRPAVLLGDSSDPAFFVKRGTVEWSRTSALEVLDSGREVSASVFGALFPAIAIPTREELEAQLGP